MKETDLARHVVAWLENQRWDVYQEVELGHFGVADIVAVLRDARPQRVWVVETKTSLSFEVIHQALQRRPWAHYVSVAVPMSMGRNTGRNLAEEVCRWKGVGVLEVRTHGVIDTKEAVEPALNRTAPCVARTLKTLKPEHKTHAPAGSNGGRWTPFRSTVTSIRNIVHASPGILFKDMLEKVQTHYRTPATARSALLKWGKRGDVIEGVLFHQEGKVWRLYPDTPDWREKLKQGVEA